MFKYYYRDKQILGEWSTRILVTTANQTLISHSRNVLHFYCFPFSLDGKIDKSKIKVATTLPNTPMKGKTSEKLECFLQSPKENAEKVDSGANCPQDKEDDWYEDYKSPRRKVPFIWQEAIPIKANNWNLLYKLRTNLFTDLRQQFCASRETFVLVHYSNEITITSSGPFIKSFSVSQL